MSALQTEKRRVLMIARRRFIGHRCSSPPCLFLTLSPLAPCPPRTFLPHFFFFSSCSLPASPPIHCLIQISTFYPTISLPGFRCWFLSHLLPLRLIKTTQDCDCCCSNSSQTFPDLHRLMKPFADVCFAAQTSDSIQNMGKWQDVGQVEVEIWL